MILGRANLGVDGAPTLGRLTSRDGKFTCVTLERSANGDHPCIPAGTYTVGWGIHHPGTIHAYRCPVLDTAAINRSCVQIHIANRDSELLGCIAVGERVSDDRTAIECSEDAFGRLMNYLEGVESFELTIVDPAT